MVIYKSPGGNPGDFGGFRRYQFALPNLPYTHN